MAEAIIHLMISYASFLRKQLQSRFNLANAARLREDAKQSS